MAQLIAHIGTLELEIAQMTRDGHHADPTVDAAMRKIDAAVTALHAAQRRNGAARITQTTDE